MRKLLIIFTALAGSCALFAQDAASEKARDAETAPSSSEARTSGGATDGGAEVQRPRSRRRRAPVATPAPAPTPTPKKRSLLGRIFGGKVKATPAPTTPIATPPPRSYRRKAGSSSSTRPDTSETTKADSDKPEKPSAEPDDKKEPDAANVAEAPTATPAPRKTSKGKEKPVTTAKSGTPEPPAVSDPEVIEKFKYDQAKAKALEDSDIQALKEKADNSTTDEESKKASRAYNKALFNKMRRIDSSLKDRIDRMESAMMKRFEE